MSLKIKMWNFSCHNFLDTIFLLLINDINYVSLKIVLIKNQCFPSFVCFLILKKKFTLSSLLQTTIEKILTSSHVAIVFLFRKCTPATFPPHSQTLFTPFPLSQKLFTHRLKELTKFAGSWRICGPCDCSSPFMS